MDIGQTKDGKFLVISSNTKEDSEIWVLPRDNSSSMPIKLFPRVKDARAHIDHLRDFFVTITTIGDKNKNFKIATLKDEMISEERVPTRDDWKDLLTPSSHGP